MPNASGAWQPEPTPNPAGFRNGSVAGVSCTGASACTAVGTYDNRAGVVVTLAERWNGSSWAIQATPNPAGSSVSQLTSVSCTSAVSCVAAGYDTGAGGTVPLIEVWNGTTWRILAAPHPPGSTFSVFFGVSCTSVRACTAVGDNGSLPLAERWNGSTWVIQPTPAPSGARSTGLFAVSCPAAGACTAAGSSTSASSGAVTILAERWDGSTWSIQATPVPSGIGVSQFGGVSCTAAGACTATGYYYNSKAFNVMLAERWNGSTWSIQATPAPVGVTNSELGAVWCTAADVCTAAGAYENGANTVLTLAETWNGSTWTVQATQNPPGSAASEFTAVSCLPGGSCTAVGHFPGSGNAELPLAERRNGSTWSIQPTAAPSGNQNSGFDAVSCPAVASCTAVGEVFPPSKGSRGLSETWNGTRWRIQATQAPTGAAQWGLVAVSCPAPQACTAVGSYERNLGSGNTYPLSETWNGWAWHLQAMPQATNSDPRAVSCTSPNACTAVGNYDSSSGSSGYSLGTAWRWDGTRWRIQSMPTPPANSSAMDGVNCTSATVCVAVGQYAPPNGTKSPQPLVETWNGTSWHIQPVPLPAKSLGGQLSAVSCTAADACTATGSYFPSATVPSALLAERWNGTAWTVQPTPKPSATSPTRFATVACVSAYTCVALGSVSNSLAFAETWNGIAWHLQVIDLPGPNQVDGVSCRAARCTAVGFRIRSARVPVTLALSGRA